jgi:hypothetical protein
MIRVLFAAAAILAAAANSFAQGGHFAHGNAFPLTTFKPGRYTISVKVIDTVTKSAYTLTDNFGAIE